MSDPAQDRPKIIVDEDWKSRAQAEKVALERDLEQKKVAEEPGQGRDGPLPEATFPVHVTTLATQALMLLGQMPNPFTGKAEVELEQSKHFIDTLEMLQEKTKGNLTPDEDQMLTEVLHELRLAYVTIANRLQARK